MSASNTQRWLLESVLIIAAYCITASAVTYVQSGIGSANLLWLPAGIALSAILIRGSAALPALLLAIVAFNFFALFSNTSSILQASAATLITAIGSTMQAFFTAWLLQRFIRNLQITTVPEALIFTLCTAVGCTIAASVGTLALLSQNRIGMDAVSLTWLTWWVGDLSGMLVVAPVVLVVRHWRHGRREWSLLSLPIIGLGCSFTLVTAFIVKHLDHDARVNDFLSSGVAMGHALERTLELSHRDLMSSHALLYNPSISRQEFHNFATGLLSQNSLIRSLNWAPRVSNAQRALFETNARLQNLPDYRIFNRHEDGVLVPAEDSDEYLPVLLAEPDASNQRVFGFNLLSDPRRREAIALARLTGQPRASGLVDLIRGGKAIVVYWPVYRNEFAREGKARDQDSLRGFVTMALEVGRLAEETLRPFEHREAETWLLDVTETDASQVLYHHIDGAASSPTTAPAPDLETLRQGLYQETGHSFAGREWVLISKPNGKGSGLNANGQFLGILAGGFAFTFMLAIYMIGRQRSEHKLRERDERLLSQNAVLTHLARFGMLPDAEVSNQLRELIATSAITLKIERVGLWLLDEDQRHLRCSMMFTRSTGEFSEGQVLNASDAPNYFTAVYEGRGFAADKAQSDPRTQEFTASYLQPLGITSMMDVPLRIGGKPAGIVCHEHIGPPRTWAPDEQNFAASIGDLASLVFETDKRRGAEAALQESYQALERKVQDRTEELRTANERLRQLDQLKSMFIASMSHELRTPLNSIIGFTGVVLQGISGPLSEKQTDHLNRVYDSARHLLALITDVIDISKIEAGYADVYIESFSLNLLIDEAIATIQPQRMDKGLGIEFKADAQLVIQSDRKRLLQCLLNLLSNAVKYSEQGSINIRLKTLGNAIAIEVEDNGIGITAEALAKLFQPFERIDTHLRVKTPGTGLGLYLTRKIMTDLLQGDVKAISAPGQGSTFTLWVPPQLPLSQIDGKPA